jgi:predicted 2-oxoglutarate/Fe(II)-dependent dioxygenase YbiX
MKSFDYYIEHIKGMFPLELCDEILEEYKDDSLWADAKVVNIGVNLNKRNCQILGISHDVVVSKNKEKRIEIDKNIFDSVGKALQYYANKHRVICQRDSGYDLLCYETGGFFKTHFDDGPNISRRISCSVILNDDYEGGEFSFFDKELNYTLNKGDILMFPSTFLYPHEILPVTNGRRYSMVTWFT